LPLVNINLVWDYCFLYSPN